jgi:hypothetical protein
MVISELAKKKERESNVAITRQSVALETMAPFGCADKPAKKHCWLFCCERKTLFRLKKKLKKTDYKPGAQAPCNIYILNNLYVWNQRESVDAFFPYKLGNLVKLERFDLRQLKWLTFWNERKYHIVEESSNLY